MPFIKGQVKLNTGRTRFKKGNIPWNKNTHIQSNTGITHFKKGMISWNKGQKGKETIVVDKNKLYQLYIIKKYSMKEIAKKMGITKSTINIRLTNYNWKRTPEQAMLYRKMDYEKIAKKRRSPIDKDKLYQLYCIEKYSTIDLEKVFNADCTTIQKRLKKYGWLRSSKDAHNQLKYIEKLRDANLGKKATLETRKKLSEVHKGLQARENHPNWQGGITPINKVIRHSDEYKQWIKFVFKRDDYTCQICGEHGGKLRANHIKTFANYPELRMELINGITICTKCDYKWIFRHEPEWESYFNFNLENRGFIESDLIPKVLSLEGGNNYDT